MKKRHAAQLVNRTEALDERGHAPPDQTRVVADDVLCSVRQLRGREAVYGRQLAATATHEVRLIPDPVWKLNPTMSLVFDGLNDEVPRVLHIGHVNFEAGVDFEAVCLCGEEVPG